MAAEQNGVTADNKLQIDFDDLLTSIGENGKYQKILLLYFGLFMIISNCNLNGVLFMTQVPDHWCKIPELEHLNITHEMYMNVTIPLSDTDGTLQYSQCEMYDRNYSGWTDNSVHECLANSTQCSASSTECRNGWNYDTSGYNSNYIIDFDVVCDKSWLAKAPFTFFAFGSLISNLVFGMLGDIYGRQRTFCWAHFFFVVASFTTTFAPSLVIYLIFRFLTGCFDQLWFTAFTMGIEFVGVSWRPFVGMYFCYLWIAGFMVLAALGYLMKNWFYLRLCITLSASVILSSLIILPESPRWLFTANKANQADAITRKMARINGKTFPENAVVTVKKERTGRIWDLFCRAWIRKRFLNMAYQYFIMAFLYYGVTVYLTTVGDIYLNMVIGAATDVPANLLAHVAMHYFSRRRPYTIGVILGAAFILCLIAVPSEMETLKITLAILGKSSISYAWAILGVICVEVLPTRLRKLGYNGSQLFGTIALIVGPYVLDMADIRYYIPPLIFGGMALIGAGISLFIPETKNIHLPDSLEYQKVRKINESISSAKNDDVKTPYFIEDAFTGHSHDAVVTRL